MTRQTLRKLSRALTLIARALEAEARQMARQPRAAETARRKLTLTPERRAALKLQGRYIGLIRAMPAARKARVKRERAKRGMAAAIRLAQRLGRAS